MCFSLCWFMHVCWRAFLATNYNPNAVRALLYCKKCHTDKLNWLESSQKHTQVQLCVLTFGVKYILLATYSFETRTLNLI